MVFRNITNPLRTDGCENDDDLEPDESIIIDNGVIRGSALFTPGSTVAVYKGAVRPD